MPGNTGNVTRRNESLISDGLKDDWNGWSGSSYRLLGGRVEINHYRALDDSAMSAGYYEFESFLSHRKQRHSARLMTFGKLLFLFWELNKTHKYTVRMKCVVLIIKEVVHMLTTMIQIPYWVHRASWLVLVTYYPNNGKRTHRTNETEKRIWSFYTTPWTRHTTARTRKRRKGIRMYLNTTERKNVECIHLARDRD